MSVMDYECNLKLVFIMVIKMQKIYSKLKKYVKMKMQLFGSNKEELLFFLNIYLKMKTKNHIM